MSHNIIILFVIEFACLAVFAVVEGNWGMALYGIGAVILNIGVLMMGK